MPRSPDDLPLPIAKLADESGISKTTLYGWSHLADQPLKRVPGPRQMHTWAQVYEFLEAHPGRYKASQLPPRRPRTAATAPAKGNGSTAATAQLRANAEAHLNAIVEALRSAETVARAHRIQLENLLTAYEE